MFVCSCLVVGIIVNFRFEIIEEEPHQNSQLQHQEDIKPQIDTEDTNILSNNAAIEKQLRNNHLKRSKQKQNFAKKVSFDKIISYYELR